MPHICGIVGLTLNMLGAAVLLRYPPVVTIFTESGERFVSFVGNATTDGVRHYRFQKWGFRVAILLLVVGFALQLADLLNV